MTDGFARQDPNSSSGVV